MSEEDIAAGSRWLPEIATKLSEAKVSLLCVTPENQVNPWLVFEADALSKTLDQTFVCPMLFDLTPTQLSGPLAQFQSSVFDSSGVLRMLQTLNSALGVDQLPDNDLEEIFSVWWPKLQTRLTETPSLDARVLPRTQADLLEEILTLSREQLRRENLRLEHIQARDKEMNRIRGLFEEMLKRWEDSILKHGKAITPAELGKMVEMVKEQADIEEQRTGQLLSTPLSSDAGRIPNT